MRDPRHRLQLRVHLPRGYYVRWGGEFENQERAMARLTVIVPILPALYVAWEPDHSHLEGDRA